jgi:hypothetical protein
MVSRRGIASTALDAHATVKAGPAILRDHVHRGFEAECVVSLVANVAHKHLVVVPRMPAELTALTLWTLPAGTNGGRGINLNAGSVIVLTADGTVEQFTHIA